MKGQQKANFQKQCASIISKTLIKLSGFVVKIPCCGDWYEPAVPNQLCEKDD